MDCCAELHRYMLARLREPSTKAGSRSCGRGLALGIFPMPSFANSFFGSVTTPPAARPVATGGSAAGTAPVTLGDVGGDASVRACSAGRAVCAISNDCRPSRASYVRGCVAGEASRPRGVRSGSAPRSPTERERGDTGGAPSSNPPAAAPPTASPAEACAADPAKGAAVGSDTLTLAFAGDGGSETPVPLTPNGPLARFGPEAAPPRGSAAFAAGRAPRTLRGLEVGPPNGCDGCMALAGAAALTLPFGA